MNNVIKNHSMSQADFENRYAYKTTEVLSDNSVVFNVFMSTDDPGITIVFAATDQDHADQLVNAINSAVGVTSR